MNVEDLLFRVATLSVFRGLLDDPVVSALRDCLQSALTIQDLSGKERRQHALRLSSAYARLVSALAESPSDDLASHVRDVALDDENGCVRRLAAGEDLPASLRQACDADLATLDALASVTAKDFLRLLPKAMAERLPRFETGEADVSGAWHARMADVGRQGFGMWARHAVFRLEGEAVVPVAHPDPVRLSDLVDYERERALILDNTRALLAGRPAANILLTGDAGTGKSSTVKAVANELAPEGLRILEVRKGQLHDIPVVLDRLADNPLSFVLFIDDLSFAAQDDDFAALKAVLEGSVSAKGDNVVIYATSNRRHLVRETFSEREGDEVHRNDTIQELISLSDRFGLHVSFSRPDKAVYLDIVHKLAAEAGVGPQGDELDREAERFATRRGGRSARGARQFVDSLVARQG